MIWSYSTKQKCAWRQLASPIAPSSLSQQSQQSQQSLRSQLEPAELQYFYNRIAMANKSKRSEVKIGDMKSIEMK
jgi:ribosomal protein L20A (L18A)